jgi:Tol biopolymer transport system component
MRSSVRHVQRTRAERGRSTTTLLALAMVTTMLLATAPAAAPQAAPSNGNIAYVAFPPNGSVLEEIYTVAPDGRMKTTRVTNNKASDVTPAWSRDGQRLAVARAERNGDCALDVYDMRKAPKRIRSYAGCYQGGVSWGPGDTELIVTDVRGWMESSLQRLDVLTGGLTPIATGASHDVTYDPQEGEGTMTTVAVSDSGPSWSPDGSQVAFTRTLRHEVLAWDDDPDGVKGGPGYYFDESLSGGYEYTVVAVHTLATEVTEIVAARDLNLPPDAWASGPRWHPSGDRLIFAYFGADPAQGPGPLSEIMEVELASGDVTRLTSDGVDGIVNFAPTYSPDGLLFLRSRTISPDDEGPTELVIQPLAGGPERVIAGQRTVNQQADWQPRW